MMNSKDHLKILDFAYTSERINRFPSGNDNLPIELANKYGCTILSKMTDKTSQCKIFAYQNVDLDKKEIFITYSYNDLKSIDSFIVDPSIKTFEKVFYKIKPQSSPNNISKHFDLSSTALWVAKKFVSDLLSNKKDYHFIQIGHSFGAYLAQFIYSFYDIETYCVEAIGAKTILDKIYQNIDFISEPQEDVSMLNGKICTMRKNAITYYFNEPNIINSFGEKLFFNSKIFLISRKKNGAENTKYEANSADNFFDFSLLQFAIRGVRESSMDTVRTRLQNEEAEIKEISIDWPKNPLDAYSYFISKKYNEKYWSKKFNQLSKRELPDKLQDYKNDILNYFLSTYLKAPKDISYEKLLLIKNLNFQTLIERYIYDMYVNNCLDFFKYYINKVKGVASKKDFIEEFKEKYKPNHLELLQQNSLINPGSLKKSNDPVLDPLKKKSQSKKKIDIENTLDKQASKKGLDNMDIKTSKQGSQDIKNGYSKQGTPKANKEIDKNCRIKQGTPKNIDKNFQNQFEIYQKNMGSSIEGSNSRSSITKKQNDKSIGKTKNQIKYNDKDHEQNQNYNMKEEFQTHVDDSNIYYANNIKHGGDNNDFFDNTNNSF